MEPVPASIDVVLCDLDGVVWLAGEPIPGSVEALEDLRRRGCRIVFVTNDSRSRRGDIAVALRSIGLGADEIEVVSSAMAAAALIDRGERVLVVGGPGIVEAVGAAGAEAVAVTDRAVLEEGPPEAVVVGFDPGFDYEVVRVAADAIRAGARFIATNTDPTYPTPTGQVPGAGSLVAAVSVASGVEPVIAGKPFPAMIRAIESLLGRSYDPSRMVVIGDRRSTDGALARRIGCRFALTSSGVEEIHDAEEIEPDVTAADLASLTIHYGHLFGR